MPQSRWICFKKTTVPLRIVHANGHVELHLKPVTAAEIMCRHPRCYVTYPYVFKQPWAVVEPDSVLALGQKYYVVPRSTIQKLQRLSPSRSPSPGHGISVSLDYEIGNAQLSKKDKDDGELFTCCVFKNKSPAKQSKRHSKNKSKKSKTRSRARNLSLNDKDKNGGLSHESCFESMLNGGRTKANVSDMTKNTRASSSNGRLCDGNTSTRTRKQDLTGNGLRSSPKKVVWSSENWQPSLESITEE
ncbi:hypothetical protein Fmac_020091 [Flemingia macrophylla]|uniref:Uncharacterized protein n=1 Tax=Flemingia macrophylla TaxID=520843 RepID=A0ABD1MBM2_9FABA